MMNGREGSMEGGYGGAGGGGGGGGAGGGGGVCYVVSCNYDQCDHDVWGCGVAM